MERSELISKLTDIFIKVFRKDNLVLTDDLTANDVDNWDSLSHMILVKEIEDTFHFKFSLKELNRMRNVGEMIDLISNKV